MLKPKRISKKEEYSPKHHGEIYHGFIAPEFLTYPRGKLWYLVSGLLVVFALISGVLSGSIIFTLVVLMVVGVYWLLHHREPRRIEVMITKYGLRHDGVFFPFGDIKSFWFVHKPPFVSDLKLEVKKGLNSILTIHIFGQDPFELRALLSPHLQESKDKDESLTDAIARALRL